MLELYEKLKKYNIKDYYNAIKNDSQYISLSNFYISSGKKEFEKYLFLIVSNSLICYQLSGLGEDYWEEFSIFFSNNFDNITLNKQSVFKNFDEFLRNSKNNKRLLEMKLKRLDKFLNNYFEIPHLTSPQGRGINIILEDFINNQEELNKLLAKIMKQKATDKTIVFAIKMLGYGALNKYENFEYSPLIAIPIDSRLTKIFEKYARDYSDIRNFYNDLTTKLGVAPLLFDALIWTKEI